MIVEFIRSSAPIDIAKLEAQLRVALPEDYRSFLAKTNGVISKDESSVPVALLNTSVEIDSLFGVNPDKPWLDIAHCTEMAGSDLPEGALVIGRDLLGGFFVLMCNEDIRGVYYWDDKFNFEQSNDDSNAYFVADSFSAFLDLLNGIQEASDMEQKQILPIGSIVLLDGGIQKLMIIGRALNVRNGERQFYFDYAAVAYPEGLIGDQIVYFNHENVAKLIFQGFEDDDNAVFVKRIEQYVASHPELVKGNAELFRQQ